MKNRLAAASVATSADVHVDDLATLVHGPVHVPPDAGHLDVGLVDEPAAANGVPGRPGRVNHKRREVLDPPIQRDVIHFYPAFARGALRRSRYDKPNRRYQRTASTITSGGNR